MNLVLIIVIGVVLASLMNIGRRARGGFAAVCGSIPFGDGDEVREALDDVVDQNEQRLIEMEGRYERRLLELEERLDFAERLLGQQSRERRLELAGSAEGLAERVEVH